MWPFFFTPLLVSSAFFARITGMASYSVAHLQNDRMIKEEGITGVGRALRRQDSRWMDTELW
jgi:hypothetical protein